MKAIVISYPGGPEVLKLEEIPAPQASGNQVLIRVKAAGVNRSDVISRKGGYGDSGGIEKSIPGLEVAGIIESCGPDVKRWKVGDKVCSLNRTGGYAEYIAVNESHCLPIPTGFSFEEAASLPETILTVWYNVFQSAKLKPGEKLLVHGGSSGIGLTAIQLAKAFGSPVFATAGNEEKCKFCEDTGAAKCINYKTADFETELKDQGIDVILDMVGGDYTEKNIRLLSVEGRLVFINAMRGVKTSFNALELMAKRLIITGSMLKTRDDDFKTRLIADAEKRVWPLLESGEIKPIVYQVFSLTDASKAHELMESSDHIGKIILKVD